MMCNNSQPDVLGAVDYRRRLRRHTAAPCFWHSVARDTDRTAGIVPRTTNLKTDPEQRIWGSYGSLGGSWGGSRGSRGVFKGCEKFYEDSEGVPGSPWGSSGGPWAPLGGSRERARERGGGSGGPRRPPKIAKSDFLEVLGGQTHIFPRFYACHLAEFWESLGAPGAPWGALGGSLERLGQPSGGSGGALGEARAKKEGPRRAPGGRFGPPAECAGKPLCAKHTYLQCFLMIFKVRVLCTFCHAFAKGRTAFEIWRVFLVPGGPRRPPQGARRIF